MERWLLPGECLLCRESTGPADELVCSVCRTRWRPLPEPQCGRCGQPLDPLLECRICAEWPAEFGGVRSAVWLDAAARQAVHLLKYDGWWRIAASLAAGMERIAPPADTDVLVPVPLGAARERSRGYNQSAKLADELGKRIGRRTAPELLRRGKETTTQTALTPEAREANVRGAFTALGRAPARVVLVDDVFTTGATLAAAARALIDAGAVRVSAVTFARAERPLDGIGRTL